MAQFGGIIPDGIDLSQFEGIPEYLTNKQSRLSDYNPQRDKDLMVKFFQDSYFEGNKTKEMGIPIFSTQTFIQIVIPDNRSKFVQMIKLDENGKPLPSVAKWVSRFPKEWEAFRRGIVEGFPLSKIPGADKGLIATLEMVGVKTAEALKELEGEILDRVPELKELKAKAIKFLDSKDIISEHVEKTKQLEAELESLKAKKTRTVRANANSSADTHASSPQA